MKILRYNITTEVEIHTGAVFLDAQPGQSGLSAWFLCDPEAELEKRRFAVIGTGQDIPDAIMDCPHLATIKAVLPMGDNKAMATALHIFDTTGSKVAIEGIDFSKPPGSKADKADWWKE
jgi:hypothetical protein